MKLKKILALLTILLLTLTACKSTEEPVVDEKPLKLSDREGVYKGSVTIDSSTYYSIVEVKNTGEILVNASKDENTVAGPSLPSFNPTSEKTSFSIETTGDNLLWDIVFTSKTTLTLKCTTTGRDFKTLTI